MADVFSMGDAKKLLSNKFVLLIGDSNMRGLYKDLLCLLHQGTITPQHILQRGSEELPQCGDEVLKMASLKMGRSYFEVRQCKKKEFWLRYIFVTQAAAPVLMEELRQIEEGRLPPPDIIVVNSCLWDLTRWGPEQEDRYKENVANLFHRCQSLLPPASLVVWLASLPVATERVKGGVFIQQIEFMKHSMRFMLLEANMFVHNLCQVFGFSFLDLHYYMQFQLSRRTNDGLHWEPPAVRYMVNLLLTHIALAFDEELPGNIAKPFLLQKHIKIREAALEESHTKKIYLDSRIMKHLEKLGVPMDKVSSSGSKKDEPQRRTMHVTRQPSRAGHSSSGGGSSSKSVFAKPPNSRIGDLSGNREVKSALRGTVTTYQHSVGQQIRGPSSQFFTGNGPSDFVQQALPLLSNSNVAWQHLGYNQQRAAAAASLSSTATPFPSYSQPGQHRFSLTSNEFWRDYPVHYFPWNQQW